jgi:hypothetical protein
MSTVTLSIRVPAETKRWLERFSKGRGSGGGAAALLLEEARRRETFPAVDFRDTPAGRLAYVHGTRVPVFLVCHLGVDLPASEVAAHYGWPLWKAESALAYGRMFSDEMAEDEQFWSEAEDELALRLPGLHTFTA